MSYRTTITETAQGGIISRKHEVKYFETEHEKRARKEKENMERTFMIDDIQVNEETFNAYNSRRYEVPGFGEMTLTAIGIYAHSNEDSELHDACYSVLQQIKAEISGTDEEPEPVQHQTIDAYIKDLHALYKNVAAERARIEEQRKTDREHAKAASDTAESDYEVQAARLMHLEADQNYSNSMKKIQESTEAEISAIREGLQEYLTDYYMPDAEKIDDNAVKLLKSGIKLTDTEISNIARRFKDNPTMMRLLCDLFEEKGINNPDVLMFSKRTKEQGHYELEIFDRVAGYLKNAVYASDVNAVVWRDDNGLFDSIINTAVDDINA